MWIQKASIKSLFVPALLEFTQKSVLYYVPWQTANDFMVICNVAKILELVVPLMEHPSETFLATIEEDLMKLIIKYGMTVSGSGFLDTYVACIRFTLWNAISI